MGETHYRVADYIADFFYSKGVRNVYSLPGGGAMHLIDAFTKHLGLNHVSFFHEQGASIAAEAAARTAGNDIGICCVTTGPGATNAITAVAGAWIESSPLIIISGQVKTGDMLGTRKIRQSGVQEVQITKLVKPITKFCCLVRTSNEVPDILEKAYCSAITGRKGPVWIDVPLDIQGTSIKKFQHIEKVKFEFLKEKYDTEVSQIFDLLQASERPLFFWGNGVNLDKAGSQIAEFINVHSIPSVFTWNASTIIAYDNKMNMGRPGVVAQRHANFIVQKSDLIIAVGTSLDNVLTAYNPKNFAPNAVKVLVNIDPHQLKNCSIPNTKKVLSSAKVFIQDLDKLLKKRKSNKKISEWISECTDLKQKFENDFPSETDDFTRISHRDFVLKLSTLLRENQLIATGSSGLAIEAFYMMFRNKLGQKYFLTSGLGSMGFGLPQAIAISIENHKKDVVLIESDGSLAMNIQELQTVVNNRLPICLILMNNDGYASIRNTQTNYFEGRFFGTGEEANQKMPDWQKIADAYGFRYTLVERLEELEVPIENFYQDQEPCLIDVRLAANERLQPKCAAIPQSDGSIVSMPLEDMTPLLHLDELKAIMGEDLNSRSILARK